MGADEKMLQMRHARLRCRAEAAEHQARHPARRLPISRHPDRPPRRQEIAQAAMARPRSLPEPDIELRQPVGAELVGPGRRAVGADPPAGEEIGEGRMLLPVADERREDNPAIREGAVQQTGSGAPDCGRPSRR
jgi:hypothetical protein